MWRIYCDGVFTDWVFTVGVLTVGYLLWVLTVGYLLVCIARTFYRNYPKVRFYRPRLMNGMMASADGPIKTFPLRGIKDSPPYMHDGRLLTLEDTVEFFNAF
jgi:hypothetical protein